MMKNVHVNLELIREELLSELDPVEAKLVRSMIKKKEDTRKRIAERKLLIK